jgi:hypothetical protein
MRVEDGQIVMFIFPPLSNGGTSIHKAVPILFTQHQHQISPSKTIGLAKHERTAIASHG